MFRVTGHSGPHASYSFIVEAPSAAAAAELARVKLHITTITSAIPVAAASKAERTATRKRELAVEKALAAIAY
jgi:hypothetical protein